MNPLLNDLATLRYVIHDGGKSRRHRYTVLDKLENDKVLAKFDDLSYAKQCLKQMRDDYIERLNHEHQTLSVA